nr:hypothetical protein [Klebsiella pneumoniae]
MSTAPRYWISRNSPSAILPDGPEKSLGFIDDPGNTDFAALLNAAEARKTIQLYVELPNKRTATMLWRCPGGR